MTPELLERRRLAAFEAVGIEIEYMIVDAERLDVAPIADRVLAASPEGAALAWSNELVAHVIELKNPRPARDLCALVHRVQREVGAMNARLRPLGARLMPGGMHPWMDPRRETRLWPHDGAIYETYHRLFDCRSHGWANLQSMHINLPFADDREFARLHEAVRLVLPILPAIAASSPFAGGVAAGALDFRLEAYRTNADRIPEMTGAVIPEPVSSRREYEHHVLAPLYKALAPLDPAGVLRHEWANARGAIARFDRSALEIRALDTQECPAADLGLAAAVVDLVRYVYARPPMHVPTSALARVLCACIRDADCALVDAPDYVAALTGRARRLKAHELWRELAERMSSSPGRLLWEPVLSRILAQGPLARRLVAAAGAQPTRERLAAVYAKLCACLERGRFFDPSS